MTRRRFQLHKTRLPRNMTKRRRRNRHHGLTPAISKKLNKGDKDWDHACSVCGEVPTVHPTGLCGPCCFGQADTAGGNW